MARRPCWASSSRRRAPGACCAGRCTNWPDRTSSCAISSAPRRHRLADRCDATAGDARACLSAAAAWIEARLGRAPAVDPPIAWIAERIRRRRGNVAIGALRDAAGLSAARLAAGFREQIGVTAKTYARIHRFHHAAARLRAGGSPLDVALEAGYYDQPHLNADFRELSGLTPASFAAQCRGTRPASTCPNFLPRPAMRAVASLGRRRTP